MTNDQAKEILKLYRPGTADAVDPAFAEALELCEHDSELKQWFGSHCALYAALRSKFKQISVPEGLKEQIIAERQVQAPPVWQRAVILAGAVAAVVIAVFGIGQFRHPSEPNDFAAFRGYMDSYAERAYAMDVNTTDLDQIRLFFSQNNAIADYVLPESLQKNAKAAGCVATTWHGKNVSMICFQTGRTIEAGYKSDLWLFITDRTVAQDAPRSDKPTFEKINGVMTASWTVGNRTYVLATDGDQQFLDRYLSTKAVL